MVASAPSPLVEWPPPSLPGSIRGPGLRRLDLGGPRALLLGDIAVAVVAVLLITPYGSVADLALAGGWVALLVPSRMHARGPAAVGAHPLTSVMRCACALALLGLALATVADAELDTGALAAYVAVVAAAGLLQRGPLARLGHGSATHGVTAVVAGHRHGVERMLEELRTAESPFTVVAVCLSGRADTAPSEVPVVRGLRNLASGVVQHGADAVIVVPCRHVDPARVRRLAWHLEARGTAMFVGTGLRGLGESRARIGVAGSLPLIHVRHAALHGGGRVVKAVWERLAAAVALAVLTPLLLVLALAVRLDSEGPALFRQTRVGRDGRPFTMLKLRTMGVDAESRRAALAAAGTGDGVLFKMTADPRVTRVGRILRRYSLDELPQLVNVVRGEMALVGPRPPLPSEVDAYDRDTHRRLVVSPGLTGLWQVSGRSDLDWEKSVQLDLWYVENWSLALDLRIVLRTVGAVVGHRGAY